MMIISKKIDIIWNITKICPWNCKICCVDALQVYTKENKILMQSNGIQTTTNMQEDVKK